MNPQKPGSGDEPDHGATRPCSNGRKDLCSMCDVAATCERAKPLGQPVLECDDFQETERVPKKLRIRKFKSERPAFKGRSDRRTVKPSQE